MTTKAEQAFIDTCISLIERKLTWGPGSSWTNYDFEKLSDNIFDTTQVVLSVTTLKRVWGKLKYPNAPSITTLNTLAAYLGFEDWRAFKQSHETAQAFITIEPPVKKQVVRAYSKLWYVSLIPIGLIAYYFVTGANPREKKLYKPEDFSFSANKIYSEGVPNSVVFHYNASRAKTDSIYIVQTWDINRKTLVPKDGLAHSAIYYYPGFFRTKLIIGDQVVKNHDLQISSGGWLALAENGKEPLYFKKKDYLRDSLVEVDENMLQKYNLSVIPQAPRIRFFNQGDFGDLQNDNFIFETTLKNAYN